MTCENCKNSTSGFCNQHLPSLTSTVKEENERLMKIVEKHLLSAHKFYYHDSEAHKKGQCSYPMIAICEAEENKWKYGIEELLLKTLRDIEIDFMYHKIINNK